MQPRVAIVIRTKDRGRLLGRALDSVLGQTFTDWHAVLINDGGSPAQVDEALSPRAASFEHRLTRLDNDASRGMEAASNQAIAAVQSEFIAIHDDDDEWDPEFLATTVAHLDQHPEQGGVTVETEIVFERLTSAGREVEERVTFEPQMRQITLIDSLHYNRFVPISFLFRRDVYSELGGFAEDLPVVGDWDFHLRFLVHHEIGLIKGRPLAFWNQRRSSKDSEANSVIATLDQHHLYSLKVRDRLLREHVREFGLGPLLYQRELLVVEADRLHQRLDEVQRSQDETISHVTGQITGVLHELEQLRHMVHATSMPLPLRVARSIRRRLRDRLTRMNDAGQSLELVPDAAMPSSPAANGETEKIAVLGDLGQGQYHVGDEAMAHACISELQKRGLNNFVLLTCNVEESARLFGYPAAKRPDVPWNAYERHQLLQEVKAHLEGSGTSEAAAELVRAWHAILDGCQTLIVAGGGNLTSQCGGLLFERIAAIRIARAMGLNVLVTGQTVGPVLTEADGIELAEALRLCTVVGARERHTLDLLSSLNVEASPVLDDASFFGDGTDDSFGNGTGDSPQITRIENLGHTHAVDIPARYIAATFAPWSGAMPRDDYHRHMARLLDLASAQLQLPVLLLPHVSTLGAPDGDVECHTAIARLSRAVNIQVHPQGTAMEIAGLTAGAELVISSRYHPVVFALAAAVPVLPVAVDYYGEVRLGGALDHWGAGHLLRSLRHLAGDGDVQWVESVLRDRERLAAHLRDQRPALRATQDSWWDSVADALRGLPAGPPEASIVPRSPMFAIESAESATAARLNANNELAIGDLTSHNDWLQGEINAMHRRMASSNNTRPLMSEVAELLEGHPTLRTAKRWVKRLVKVASRQSQR